MTASITLEQLTTDPHPVHAALRRNTPVAWVEALGGWLVTSRELAISVMRDAERFTVDHAGFTTAQVVGPSMLSLDGDEHRRHRSPFRESFKAAHIKERFSRWLADRARRDVAAIAPAGAGELRMDLAAPFAVEVVAELLAMIDIDPVELLAIYRDIVGAVNELSAGKPMPRSGPAAVDELRRHVIAASSRDGILAAAAMSLSDDEILSNAAVMMFGGIETNEAMNASALWYLLTVDGLYAQVAADRNLVAALIEESLRLEPAAARVDRFATCNTELGGVAILEDDLVIVSLAAANRDPAWFVEPDEFRLHRADMPSHVTFAQGPHICLGRDLARMETAALVNAVLDGLPHLALDIPSSIGPRGLVFRKPVALVAGWQIS